MKSIFLIGYMGSGKSTIGKTLAKKQNIPFIDLDQYIEKQENTSVRQLFEEKGELSFRKIERQVLTHLLESKKPKVIALGGGTPCYFDNMEKIINSPHSSIYLNAAIPLLVERLSKEKFTRPLIAHLASHEEILEFVAKHLFERNPYYRKANYQVAIQSQPTDEVVEEIVRLLS